MEDADQNKQPYQSKNEPKHIKLKTRLEGSNDSQVLDAIQKCSPLKINQSLFSLDLHSHQISSEGCKWLSEALEINQSLTSLHLGFNEISSEGCKWLSRP
eukprot:TRINITY_DN1696_c0_g2_i1.p1 TRINITY_DN1696_c0_g2~~TRINITY_DN1696_c0_g2_i1.p1  ORF type:complete len:100 (+),score=5.80 TRINITY_DN1696_c0_g2_i1:93-392(+)